MAELLVKIVLVRMTETMNGKLINASMKRGLKVSQLVRMILTDWLEKEEDADGR